MPSPILDEDKFAAAVSEEYVGAGFLAFVKNTVLFQAEVASVPSGNAFAQISFTNVTTGAYTDIREGMVVLLSTELSNYAQWYYRGRVRKTPTSSILYINEMSEELEVGDIITVINTYEPRERARRLTFVDWDLPFEDLAPVVKNMQSAYAKITSSGSATFAFSPVGQAMAEGDSINDATGYLWEFDGSSSVYIDGAADEREIEVELSDDTEWGRLTITTVNGVSSWFAFSIHIGHPATDPRFVLCHDPVGIDMSVETGYNASVMVYGNFDYSTVLDRTRAVVIVDETYGSEPDPQLGNIRFVGYLSKDVSASRGDAEYGVVQSNQIELQGLLTIVDAKPMVSIAVRDEAEPDAWDEMVVPTTQRVTSHILTRHSTIPNLCAIDFGVLDNTWIASNFDITDSSLMDAVRTVGNEIVASLVSDAAGQLVFEIHGSFLSEEDRDDLPFVVPEDLNAGNVFEFSLERVHLPRVGKIEMGARVFFEDGTPSVGYTALAPAVAFGEGPERVQIPNALLPAGATAATAAQRAAFWFSYKNNSLVLNGQLTDGFGWLSPSTAQWWPFSITATDTVRGIVINSDTRWLLISARTIINEDGTQEVEAQWIPETMAGRAMILVAKSPNVIETELPIVPIRGAIGAYPPRASINYDTVDPTNQIRRDPFSSWQTTPWPASEAAAAANKQPKAGCRTFGVNLRNSSNTSSGVLTTLGATYKVKASGSGKIINGSLLPNINLEHTFPGIWNGPLTYQGKDGVYDKWDVVAIFAVGDIYPATYNVKDVDDKCMTVISFTTSDGTETTYQSLSCPGALISGAGVPSVSVSILGGYGDTDGMTFHFVIRDDTGGSPAQDVFADPFYIWNEDEDGNPINVQLNPYGGLYFAGSNVDVGSLATPTPPPFNDNHIYEFTWIGTGNVLWARFEDTDHTDNQSVLQYVEICGPGAGQ